MASIKEKLLEVLMSENFETEVTEFHNNLKDNMILDYMIANITRSSNTLSTELLSLTVEKMGLKEFTKVTNSIEVIIKKNNEKIIVLEKLIKGTNNV